MDDVETLREFQIMNVVVALHVLVLEAKPLMYAQLRIWESVHFCAILICGRAMDEKRKKKNTQKKSFEQWTCDYLFTFMRQLFLSK